MKSISCAALWKELRQLEQAFPAARVFRAGKSALGKEIPALGMGRLKNASLFVGATHGEEWLTSLLLMRFAWEIAAAWTDEAPSFAGVTREKGLIIVPMLNPDGVEIALDGPRKAGPFRDQTEPLYRANGGKWQANARGVDLNHNFDAGWNILREMETVSGITGPAATRYGGPYPHSEPETRGIINLIYAFQPRRLYSFHSQGEEIFWEYGGLQVPQAESIARALSALSGYTLVKNSGLASHGGLKDWFIQEFRRPGFTIEIGKGENPLPIEDLEPIYGRLLPLLTAAAFL
ncbi:MAG TPA: gamma-D-glutamyl-meso-diaminopimelate peptidase [Candidatus Merdivicinus excrementipullorum]|uniref:Gamma-D-glutamyl-meso-diaminopimelate peptidase n=1 Tax=Candidatus Merdivicinus excrementipullorum TaxID=2840867 RepID=A0A9D1FLE5_9FIRM|nr:gamma-D-glutamyl-meso-diaminopimelate peptidase [Candidatus Merdivicinus excrementipullorum]